MSVHCCGTAAVAWNNNNADGIMKIYVICTTVNTTDRTLVQVSVLYDICKKAKSQKKAKSRQANLFHRNLDTCTLSYKLSAEVIFKGRTKSL